MNLESNWTKIILFIKLIGKIFCRSSWNINNGVFQQPLVISLVKSINHRLIRMSSLTGSSFFYHWVVVNGCYLWRHVLPTAPPFILWLWKFEILFGPLPRSSFLLWGQRWQPIQLGFSLNIRGRGGGLDTLLMSKIAIVISQYRLLFGFFLLYTDRVPFELLDSAALLWR
jgi:hypothetical protein